MDTSLLFEAESYDIRGAIFDVYREMGPGLLEAVYQECLEHEFSRRKIPFVAQSAIHLQYKGVELQQTYKPDFICYDKILVEIKSVDELGRIHRSQLHNYLKITGFRLGFLVNFNHDPGADVVRIVL
ncbi:hypothetical protein McpSp1_11630 [Methanocorpusculaceae archaeon Sp1]|nr:hypothetical protein [Methanocorpusculaceae archaeon Sp1]